MHCSLVAIPSLGWKYRPAFHLERRALGSPALWLSHRSHLIGNVYKQEANRMREGLQEAPNMMSLVWHFQESIKPQQLLFSTQHLHWGAYSKTEKLSVEKTHHCRKLFQHQTLYLERDGLWDVSFALCVSLQAKHHQTALLFNDIQGLPERSENKV